VPAEIVALVVLSHRSRGTAVSEFAADAETAKSLRHHGRFTNELDCRSVDVEAVKTRTTTPCRSYSSTVTSSPPSEWAYASICSQVRLLPRHVPGLPERFDASHLLLAALNKLVFLRVRRRHHADMLQLESRQCDMVCRPKMLYSVRSLTMLLQVPRPMRIGCA
jgi:hypothetical protein